MFDIENVDFSSPETYFALESFFNDLADAFSNAHISVADDNGVLDARIKAVYSVSLRDQAQRTRKVGESVQPRYDTSNYRVGGANFTANKPESQG